MSKVLPRKLIANFPLSCCYLDTPKVCKNDGVYGCYYGLGVRILTTFGVWVLWVEAAHEFAELGFPVRV